MSPVARKTTAHLRFNQTVKGTAESGAEEKFLPPGLEPDRKNRASGLKIAVHWVAFARIDAGSKIAEVWTTKL